MPDTISYFTEAYNNCTIRYGDLKKQLAADICKHTLPIKDRIWEIQNDSEYLRKVATMGKELARESAKATLKEVRAAVGFKSF